MCKRKKVRLWLLSVCKRSAVDERCRTSGNDANLALVARDISHRNGDCSFYYAPAYRVIVIKPLALVEE